MKDSDCGLEIGGRNYHRKLTIIGFIKVSTEIAERHHRHNNLLLKAIHCKLNWHEAQQHF